MKTRQPIFFILISLFMYGGCKKDEKKDDGWVNCTDCTLESWVGVFSGTTGHFDATSLVETNGLELTIEFEETATYYLTAYIVVPQFYSATVSGEWKNPYSVSFAGTGASLDATLSAKEGQLRLTGNSKKYHVKADSIIVDEVITFEVYK